MEINGTITILVGVDECTMSIMDEESRILFVKVKMTPSQFTQALSRLSHTKCEKVEVFNLDKVGKKHEHKEFVFEIGNTELKYTLWKEIAVQKAIMLCPEGWEPDLGFNSQDSFFTEDRKLYGRTTIRRWV